MYQSQLIFEIVFHCCLMPRDRFSKPDKGFLHILQSSQVEPRHAVLEYDNQLDCFLIEDLNTFHGTYVNDCRVQNSKVKVDHGDIVRFGHGKDNISIVPKFFVISVQQIEQSN